jgi:tetratricopeptide (TPR) repeat protein
VRRALDYLEKLSAVRNDDPGLRLELAQAYERIARVQGGIFDSHLGDTAGARKSLVKALAIREDFVRADRGNPVYAAALAETELQLSEVLSVSREWDAAVGRVRHAVSILEKLSAGSPGDRVASSRLGRARRYLGAALSHGSGRAEGLSSLASAAATFESLCGSSVTDATSNDCHQLAITRQVTVDALAGTKDRAGAFANYDRAVSLFEELVRSKPASFALQRELAYCHMGMGSFLEWSGDYSGAVTYYGRAVPILEELATADSRNADVHLLLAEAYNSFGYACARTGDVPVAFRNLQQANRLLESIASGDPVNGRARLGLARLADSFGSAYEMEASKIAGDARVHSLPSALDWYR